MKTYKIKTQSFCHWCDYHCRKGHKCSVYKRFAKSKKDRKNIFNLPIDEFKKEVNNWLESKSEEEILNGLEKYKEEDNESRYI